jgi:nucleotide-binding universal stress UspA family protein
LLQSFNNILLPIDLSLNTEMAVAKAIELAGSEGAVIHIMHVVNPKNKNGSSFNEEKISALNKLKEIVEGAVPGAEVNMLIIGGKPVEKIIIQKAKEVHAQLIILARHAKHKWLRFNKPISSFNIAKETRSAVLTVQPGAFLNKIKSIVLPIRYFIPKRKVEMLTPFVNNKGITIYLVSIMNKESDDLDYSSTSHALIETYRILKEAANCQIVHKLVNDNNLAKTLLQFAESVHADMLLLNPEESQVRSMTGLQDFSYLLKRQSRLQVMAVDSYSGEP